MKRRSGRSAFTITELLVSMALIMLIMSIMAEAFGKSLEMFSAMKSIGDMDQKMRAAIVILSRDLSDDHFGQPNTRLSGIAGAPITNPASGSMPGAGFFVVYQDGVAINEGNDADGNPCPRNTTGMLHFTVNRAYSWNNGGNIKYGRRENYLAAYAPIKLAPMSRFQDGSNYYSQVAEVAYFLRPTGDTTTPTAANPGGLPRYTLYRRQAVILTDTDAKTMAGAPGDIANYCDVSWAPLVGNAFNNFSDVVDIKRRRLLNGATAYGPNVIPRYEDEDPNSPFKGNDILLTDVLSFDIQLMHANIIPPNTIPGTFTGDKINCDTSVDPSLWTPPGSKGIKAIQIIIRVWDVKAQAARQITIVQDM